MSSARARFNSKLVRLKDETSLSALAKRVFQFQTGAIKSKAPHDKHSTILTSFNSKLVRLKGNVGLVIGRRNRFQFQTGAIKS